MGHKDDPATIEWQKKNLKTFNDWLSNTGKKMILPIRGKSVVYAGFPNTEFSKFRSAARKNDALMPMWQALEKINKLNRDYEGIAAYDTVVDVLKRIKKPLPILHETNGANIGHKKKYLNMLDVANALCDKKWRLLPKGFPDGDHKKIVWGGISKIYVENSEGDLAIFEGSQKQLKQLDSRFTLINDELEKMLQNKKLSKSTIASAKAMAKRYSEHHSKNYKQFEKYLADAKKGLKKG